MSEDQPTASGDARPIWPVYVGIDGRIYLALSMPPEIRDAIERFLTANRERANRLDLSGLTAAEVVAKIDSIMAADERRADRDGD
jgi:hypothetical protein